MDIVLTEVETKFLKIVTGICTCEQWALSVNASFSLMYGTPTSTRPRALESHWVLKAYTYQAFMFQKSKIDILDEEQELWRLSLVSRKRVKCHWISVLHDLLVLRLDPYSSGPVTIDISANHDGFSDVREDWYARAMILSNFLEHREEI